MDEYFYQAWSQHQDNSEGLDLPPEKIKDLWDSAYPYVDSYNQGYEAGKKDQSHGLPSDSDDTPKEYRAEWMRGYFDGKKMAKLSKDIDRAYNEGRQAAENKGFEMLNPYDMNEGHLYFNWMLGYTAKNK